MDIEQFLEVIKRNEETKNETIDLPFKNLTEVPPEIGNLTHLKRLYLHGNKIETISPEIGKLVDLEVLDLACNKLKFIPQEIGKLKKLKELYLRTNRLIELPPEIGDLEKLERFYVYDNQLTELPNEIQKLQNLTGFWIHDNKFNVYIPPEVLERDEPSEIVQFYMQHKNAKNRKYSSEVKILIVGEAGAGKTSLLNQLVHRKFNQDEDKTEGISINKQKFVSVKSSEIRLNIWDFGGQEIIRSTHQFFLTRRSLYVLVVDARQGEQDLKIEYWLQLIKSFGKGSPIIVAINKVDEHKLEIDRRGLLKKYLNIKSFVYISCKEGIGIDELSDLIVEEISHLEHIETPWLESQFRVKNQLEESNKDYIPYNEFVGICSREGVSQRTEQEFLIDLLHDLGIALHYQDDLSLRDKNILNPEWITEGVYRILNSDHLFENKGILNVEQLENILDRKRYPSETHFFIIQMMKRFDLCFELNNSNNQQFLMPDLLPKEEVLMTWDDSQTLNFEYHYDFLPTSIISRFIVRTHTLIYKNMYWRGGVILGREENQALIKSDYEERKISISISGKRKTRRDLLSIVRSDFERVHGTIPNLDIEQRVVLPDNRKIAVSYQHLLRLEEIGHKTIIPEGSIKEYIVEDLLNGIEPKTDRKDEKRKNDTNFFTPTQRLHTRLIEYQEEYSIYCERIRRVRKAFALETNSSSRFKLENELKQLEEEREGIEKEIISIEIELENI
jgi:internalin A